jgi:hypothetical protein
MAIWARAFEKVRKLAMLYACSENHRQPQITDAGVDWAWRIVEHQTRRMLYMADLYVADSEFHSQCLKVIKYLHDSPEFTCPRSKLLQYMKCKASELNDIADTLIEQGRINAVEIKSKTKTALGYRLNF